MERIFCIHEYNMIADVIRTFTRFPNCKAIKVND
jgi:hypothetical protein